MEVWGDNNVLVNNAIVNNASGSIQVGTGSNSVAVGNLVRNAGSGGCFMLMHSIYSLGKTQWNPICKRV